MNNNINFNEQSFNEQINWANEAVTSGKSDLTRVRLNVKEGKLEKINFFIALYEFFAGLTFGTDMRDVKNMQNHFVTLLKNAETNYPVIEPELDEEALRIQSQKNEKEQEVRRYTQLMDTNSDKIVEKTQQAEVLETEISEIEAKADDIEESIEDVRQNERLVKPKEGVEAKGNLNEVLEFKQQIRDKEDQKATLNLAIQDLRRNQDVTREKLKAASTDQWKLTHDLELRVGHMHRLRTTNLKLEVFNKLDTVVRDLSRTNPQILTLDEAVKGWLRKQRRLPNENRPA